MPSLSPPNTIVDEETGVVYYLGCCVPLRGPDDSNESQEREYLSEFHRYLRSHVFELFAADEHDSATSLGGRHKPVAIGQVGVRCVFCKNASAEQKTPAEKSYSGQILKISDTIRRMCARHLRHCRALPPNLLQTMDQLSTKTKHGADASKKYWIDAAVQLGLVDTHDGIRFGRDPRVSRSTIEPTATATTATANIETKIATAPTKATKTATPPTTVTKPSTTVTKPSTAATKTTSQPAAAAAAIEQPIQPPSPIASLSVVQPQPQKKKKKKRISAERSIILQSAAITTTTNESSSTNSQSKKVKPKRAATHDGGDDNDIDNGDHPEATRAVVDKEKEKETFKHHHHRQQPKDKIPELQQEQSQQPQPPPPEEQQKSSGSKKRKRRKTTTAGGSETVLTETTTAIAPPLEATTTATNDNDNNKPLPKLRKRHHPTTTTSSTTIPTTTTLLLPKKEKRRHKSLLPIPISVVEFRPIVYPEDKHLIPAYFYLVLHQMIPAMWTTTTKTSATIGTSSSAVGEHDAGQTASSTTTTSFAGLACKYCVGHGVLGRFFPGSKQALLHPGLSNAITHHVSHCVSCPVHIREQIKQLVQAKTQQDDEKKRKQAAAAAARIQQQQGGSGGAEILPQGGRDIHNNNSYGVYGEEYYDPPHDESSEWDQEMFVNRIWSRLQGVTVDW